MKKLNESTTIENKVRSIGCLPNNSKYNMDMWEDFKDHMIKSADSKDNSLTRETINRMKEFYNMNKSMIEGFYKQLDPVDIVEFGESHYSFIDEKKLPKLLKDCKVLIITANNIEKNTLHREIVKRKPSQKIIRVIHGHVAYFIFQWNKYKVVHVHQHQIGAYRDFGLNNTLGEVLKHFRPNVVFSMGVAFGIDHINQNIGDVLVSHKLFPYNENKVTNEEIRPDRSQDKFIDSWLDVRLANTIGFFDNVTYGSILSGGSVISSEQGKISICKAYSKNDFVIGGEMEGSALFQLCHSYDIPCAVIKGICDWGVAKNGVFEDHKDDEMFKDSLQAYAMTQVVEKCDVLFRDGTLFSVAKTKALDIEKAKSKKIIISNIIFAFLFFAITHFKCDYGIDYEFSRCLYCIYNGMVLAHLILSTCIYFNVLNKITSICKAAFKFLGEK